MLGHPVRDRGTSGRRCLNLARGAWVSVGTRPAIRPPGARTLDPKRRRAADCYLFEIYAPVDRRYCPRVLGNGAGLPAPASGVEVGHDSCEADGLEIGRAHV